VHTNCLTDADGYSNPLTRTAPIFEVCVPMRQKNSSLYHDDSVCFNFGIVKSLFAIEPSVLLHKQCMEERNSRIEPLLVCTLPAS
jgi:hypothetical protein